MMGSSVANRREQTQRFFGIIVSPPLGYRGLLGLRLASGRPHPNGSVKTNVTSATCGRRCDAAVSRDLLQIWACLRYGVDPQEASYNFPLEVYRGEEGALMRQLDACAGTAAVQALVRQLLGNGVLGALADHALTLPLPPPPSPRKQHKALGAPAGPPARPAKRQRVAPNPPELLPERPTRSQPRKWASEAMPPAAKHPALDADAAMEVGAEALCALAAFAAAPPHKEAPQEGGGHAQHAVEEAPPASRPASPSCQLQAAAARGEAPLAAPAVQPAPAAAVRPAAPRPVAAAPLFPGLEAGMKPQRQQPQLQQQAPPRQPHRSRQGQPRWLSRAVVASVARPNQALAAQPATEQAQGPLQRLAAVEKRRQQKRPLQCRAAKEKRRQQKQPLQPTWSGQAQALLQRMEAVARGEEKIWRQQAASPPCLPVQQRPSGARQQRPLSDTKVQRAEAALKQAASQEEATHAYFEQQAAPQRCRVEDGERQEQERQQIPASLLEALRARFATPAAFLQFVAARQRLSRDFPGGPALRPLPDDALWAPRAAAAVAEEPPEVVAAAAVGVGLRAALDCPADRVEEARPQAQHRGPAGVGPLLEQARGSAVHIQKAPAAAHTQQPLAPLLRSGGGVRLHFRSPVTLELPRRQAAAPPWPYDTNALQWQQQQQQQQQQYIEQCNEQYYQQQQREQQQQQQQRPAVASPYSAPPCSAAGFAPAQPHAWPCGPQAHLTVLEAASAAVAAVAELQRNMGRPAPVCTPAAAGGDGAAAAPPAGERPTAAGLPYGQLIYRGSVLA